MTVRMPDEFRTALENGSAVTVRVYDDKSETAYVLVPEHLYERLCQLADGNEYAHVGKAMAGGFDD